MRKLRTRQHIIEDLGFNHVERQILKAGYIVTRYPNSDYGLDGQFRTFNENGEIEELTFDFQLKSTDSIKIADDKVKFDLSKRDLELWLLDDKPILLLVYDAVREVAYYLDMQEYFTVNRILLRQIEKFVRVYIPIEHTFTPESVQFFRKKYKK